MLEALNAMFSYSFLLRALLAGGLISLCAALLGVNLVLKRYSMIGDGLSHVGFGALSVAIATEASPLLVSAPVVVLSAFLLLRITANSKIKGDAAIAIISATALSIGVIASSLSGGMSIDVDSLMFGSILALSAADVYVSAVLAIIVLVTFVIFYNKLFALTFDEDFCRATGVKINFFNMLIAFLTAITIVIGLRIMGTLLISSLIIFPALTSMRMFKSFRAVVFSSAAVSVFCFFTGIIASYMLSIPAGASVVAVNALTFLLFWVLSIVR